MPSLLRERLGDRERFRAFAAHSVPHAALYRPRGARTSISSRAAMSTSAFAEFSAARRSRDPAIRFTRALNFEASVVRTLLQPVRLLAPLHGSDRALPSQRKLRNVRETAGATPQPRGRGRAARHRWRGSQVLSAASRRRGRTGARSQGPGRSDRAGWCPRRSWRRARSRKSA